ncbi:MAG: hypothetical protein ACOCX4_07110, partial [Planctomycetota bacterium]
MNRMIAFACFVVLFASVVAAGETAFRTPVTREDLDPAATAAWVDGTLNREVVFHGGKAGPEWVVWTQSSGPGHSGISFGTSDQPGPRHLRLGFRRAIPAGTIVARGGGALSVLAEGAPYPGDVTDEEHWQALERVHTGEYSLWVLPAGATVRALRFTTESNDPMRAEHRGHLSGVCLLPERIVNVAPEAILIASSGRGRTRFLNDHRHGGWKDIWDNEWQARGVVTPDHPEELLLLWPSAVELNGTGLFWAGMRRVEVAAFAGGDDVHPREAGDADWTVLGTFDVDHRYPSRFGPNWLGFGKTVSTRALRLRILAASPTTGVHGHVRDDPRDGRRVWLGEVMAFHPLGDGPVALPAGLAAGEETAHPPIPIRFTLDEPGYVTLAVEDAEGRRVRNLISETHFDAGEQVAWWDGLDETKVNVRVHGIYDIRGRLVPEGQYTVRGIVRPAVALRYEMAPYSPGSPPWETADDTGGWLADHSPPYDTLYVPKGVSGEPEVLIAAYVVEHGHGLIGVDLSGRKRWGIRRLGGVWTGGSHLARDAGPDAIQDEIAYVGSWWTTGKGQKEGEVRLTALQADGKGRSVRIHRMESREAATIGGLAVRDRLLVVTLPKAEQVLFVSASDGALLGTQTLPAT